jgi:hypothetical protein
MVRFVATILEFLTVWLHNIFFGLINQIFNYWWLIYGFLKSRLFDEFFDVFKH